MKNRPYKRHSKKEIEQHLKKQAASKLSIKAYCEKHLLNYATFMYWRQARKTNPPSFLQLSIPTTALSLIEIKLPNGIQAMVNSEVQIELVAKLMKVPHA